MSADKTASSSHQHSQEELAISHASQQTISQDMRSSPTVDQASNRYGARNTLLQLLLFITILYVAYVYNPQLEPSFLLACGSALLVLLVVRNLVSLQFHRHSRPPANLPTHLLCTYLQVRPHM